GSGGASGFGIAASVSIGYLNVTNSANVMGGADITATGAATVSTQTSIDAKSQADSTAVSLNSNVSFGAAVALNFVQFTSNAIVGTGSVVQGSSVTLEAVTTDNERNDYVATAFTAAGNKSGDAAFAGALALNVVDADTMAYADDGSTLRAIGDIN